MMQADRRYRRYNDPPERPPAIMRGTIADAEREPKPCPECAKRDAALGRLWQYARARNHRIVSAGWHRESDNQRWLEEKLREYGLELET